MFSFARFLLNKAVISLKKDFLTSDEAGRAWHPSPRQSFTESERSFRSPGTIPALTLLPTPGTFPGARFGAACFCLKTLARLSAPAGLPPRPDGRDIQGVIFFTLKGQRGLWFPKTVTHP